MTDNILTELASGDYYEVVRQRLPWIESTILEPRRVVEALRISPAYIETTVEVLEKIWGGQKWYPASEPPENVKQVILRFAATNEPCCVGFYLSAFRLYSIGVIGSKTTQLAHPTHWRELREEER